VARFLGILRVRRRRARLPEKEDAIDYASQRFGGSSGEVHVYDATGATIERKIVIDGRGQYQKGRE
jgi:hypothetical protein